MECSSLDVTGLHNLIESGTIRMACLNGMVLLEEVKCVTVKAVFEVFYAQDTTQ